MPSVRPRKKYLVEKGFQLRFARFVILFVVLAVVATAGTVFFITFSMLGEKLSLVYPQARLSEIFRSVHLAILIDLLVILPVIYAVSIMFSHRIAGPLPKIYQAIRQIGQGDYKVNIVLRKNDELQELAEVINEAAKNLNEKEAQGGLGSQKEV